MDSTPNPSSDSETCCLGERNFDCFPVPIISKSSDSLLSLYGKVQGNNISEQLITAENWLKERPNNPTLLLTLGRISLRNELWGKAKEYFEASIQLQPSLESYAELCRLSPRLDENNEQTNRHLKGLIESIALPKLPMP